MPSEARHRRAASALQSIKQDRPHHLKLYFRGRRGLAESLVKPEGRGAIAAFSPSGLPLDAPAHELHRALMAELAFGRHARLGDAILAAQAAYARTGQMPELVSIYQLFGDPAMDIR